MPGKTYSDEAVHKEMVELDKATNISLLKEVAEELTEVMDDVHWGKLNAAQAKLQEAVRTLDRVVEDME